MYEPTVDSVVVSHEAEATDVLFGHMLSMDEIEGASKETHIFVPYRDNVLVVPIQTTNAIAYIATINYLKWLETLLKSDGVAVAEHPTTEDPRMQAVYRAIDEYFEGLVAVYRYDASADDESDPR